MTLKEMPKVGDKVRFIGDFYNADVTKGRLYEINEIDSDGHALFIDNSGSTAGRTYIRPDALCKFELVEEAEESPSVNDLIANLARRVSELEDEIANRDYYEKMVEAYSDEEAPAESPKAEQIRQACDSVRDLLVRKNHDYGDSFAQQYAKYGLQSALIRMDDKMRRLETLADGAEAQVAESIEDTLADLAGYALLALVEARK